MSQPTAYSSTTANPTDSIRETISPNFPHGHGDITLITIDNVIFHVHRAVLRHSSHVFETIFERSDDTSRPPPIKMEAEASTLNHLLMFAYGNKLSPSIQDINVLAAVFRAAKRYEMDGVLQQLSKCLLEIRIINGVAEPPLYIKAPLAVLAISYAFDCTTAGRLALRECIKGSLEEHIAGAADFEVPMQLLSEILQLREKRVDWFVGSLNSLPWVAAGCFSCGRKQGEWRGQIIRNLHKDLRLESFRKALSVPLGTCLTGHTVSNQTVPQATVDAWGIAITKLEEILPALPELSR